MTSDLLARLKGARVKADVLDDAHAWGPVEPVVPWSDIERIIGEWEAEQSIKRGLSQAGTIDRGSFAQYVETGRRLVMAEDIELWDGSTLHGQWTPHVVAVEPRFWERCGAWLLEGKDADLRALLDGTYTSDDTRLIATLTGELDAERVKVAALEDKIERMIRVAKVAADASTESRAAAKAEGAAKERERIADAIEAVSDDEERTAIVGGVIYVQINPCLAACAPPEGGR